jgi:hypothetical protein
VSSPAVVQALLDANVNVNAKSLSHREASLHRAVALNQGVAPLLLDAGAEVDAKLDCDATPLHSAFRCPKICQGRFAVQTNFHRQCWLG